MNYYCCKYRIFEQTTMILTALQIIPIKHCSRNIESRGKARLLFLPQHSGVLYPSTLALENKVSEIKKPEAVWLRVVQ